MTTDTTAMTDAGPRAFRASAGTPHGSGADLPGAAGAGAFPGAPAEPIRAHNTVVRRLGHWTRQNAFDVRASRGRVLLDLRSARIAPGDIEIHLDIDRATVTLLVPDGAVIDAAEARRIGRCRVKDWTGTAAPGGRRIVLGGELRSAEVRVHRGGIAILSAMCSREYLEDALSARREGRFPTIDDPSR
jgi:hypothetical protein